MSRVAGLSRFESGTNSKTDGGHLVESGRKIFFARERVFKVRQWTPKNSFPTVYLCENVEAALQEYLARGRRMKLPDCKSLPMVMAGVKVKAANLLDLTDAEIAAVIKPLLEKDKIHWRAIQDRREAVSQAVGRAIREICFSGLIAPSQALHGGKSIVVFPQKLTPADSLSALALKPMPLK